MKESTKIDFANTLRGFAALFSSYIALLWCFLAKSCFSSYSYKF